MVIDQLQASTHLKRSGLAFLQGFTVTNNPNNGFKTVKLSL